MSSERTPDCCVKLPNGNASDYQRLGTVKKTANGLKYYESTPQVVTNPELAVIVIVDVGGPNKPHTDQQADRISKGLGVKVVSPFWFGVDHGYPGVVGPGGNPGDMAAWTNEYAPPEKVKERANDIINTLKAEGITKFSAIGFCWGGLQVSELATIPGLLVSAASVHGRKFTAQHAQRLVAPFYNAPSLTEGPQGDWVAALPSHLKDKCKYKLFGDVVHGWAASRGQWAMNDLNRRRAEEVINDYIEFVKSV